MNIFHNILFNETVQSTLTLSPQLPAPADITVCVATGARYR